MGEFELEKLAVRHCEQYGIAEDAKHRADVVNAFCVGAKVGRKASINLQLSKLLEPLYDHAAPCARCEEAERIEAEATAKLGDEIIKNGTLQDNVAKQAAEIERLSSHVEDAKEIIQKMMKAEKPQAERIKVLEAFVQKLEYANTEAGNDSIALRRKLVAAESKLTKADAVIEADRLAFKHMDAKGGLGYSVHELIGRNLAAIEQYQKGE